MFFFELKKTVDLQEFGSSAGLSQCVQWTEGFKATLTQSLYSNNLLDASHKAFLLKAHKEDLKKRPSLLR